LEFVPRVERIDDILCKVRCNIRDIRREILKESGHADNGFSGSFGDEYRLHLKNENEYIDNMKKIFLDFPSLNSIELIRYWLVRIYFNRYGGEEEICIRHKLISIIHDF
jgi:hypothetical protein